MINETMNYMNNDSVSFSSIMSNSVAVRQRRPRKKSGTQEDSYMFKNQEKKQVSDV
jgi:hypothetical protein